MGLHTMISVQTTPKISGDFFVGRFQVRKYPKVEVKVSSPMTPPDGGSNFRAYIMLLEEALDKIPESDRDEAKIAFTASNFDGWIYRTVWYERDMTDGEKVKYDNEQDQIEYEQRRRDEVQFNALKAKLGKS